MPPEYYLGAAVAVILLVLLASFLKGKRAARSVLDNSSGRDELTNQLSRIADALETIAAHLRVSPPPVEPKAAPLEEAPQPKVSEPSVSEPVAADQENSGETKKHHYVSLSMFGR